MFRAKPASAARTSSSTRSGAFYLTLVPIRPRSRGERRFLRTFPGASLRPGSLAFNPRPRRLSTPLLTPFNSTPQESYGEASHAAKVSVEESELDFCDGELSARRLHDKVRGFAGWPGTKATFAVRKETEAAADAKEVSLKIVTTRVGGEGEGDTTRGNLPVSVQRCMLFDVISSAVFPPVDPVSL